MNARIGFLIAVALLLPAASPGQAPTGTSQPLATITVFNTDLHGTIPRDFVGFSLEVATAGQGIGAFQGESAAARTGDQAVYALGRPGFPNLGYFRFMRNLGPGFLRLGGNSQDNSCWDREHAPHPDACQAALGVEDLRLFSSAAGASGWRLIVGLNLKQNDPAWALGEVRAVAREIPAARIFALEPGNEPDLFSRTPYRPAGYSALDQAREFRGYLDALAADSAGRRYAVVGPATCCGWRTPEDLALFADSVGPRRLRWLTVHNYSETTCGGRTVSIARLLSRELMDELPGVLARLHVVGSDRDLPVAMAETNSASCGGMPGVSNAFASALWGLDYAFTLAGAGFVNVDLHTSYRPGGGSSYNPVDTYGRQDAAGRWTYRNVAEPLYYALYLFAQQAAGRRFMSIGVESNANVTAYALSPCAGCAVNVFVLNKDTSAAGPVKVHLARRMGAASLLLLAAPSLGAGAAEVRIGGAQFASDGSIGRPRTTPVAPDGAGDYTFVLPNAAIAVLQVLPGRGGH